jgi:hypothetical protein
MTVNVSVPGGALTAKVHVVPVLPVVQPGDVGVVLKTTGAFVLTAMESDCVSGEMVDGCAPGRLLPVRCGMRIRTSVRISRRPAGVSP